MPTAKERAREAAYDILTAPEPWHGSASQAANLAADAASDVWEPVVRNLVATFEHAPNYVARSHPRKASQMRVALIQAKEALADADG